MKLRHSLPAGSLLVALALAAGGASAHISLDEGGTHKSRYGGDALKAGPCGVAGGTRSTNVYTYRPGETIDVTIIETISHPSYFRISFDDDGDDAFVDPQWIDPPYRDCMADAADHCKKGEGGDFYSNDSVLMDDLDQHNYNTPVVGGNKPYSWSVKLPAVTCDNCTLQIIQVMEDPPGIHAPYEPGTEDIYYQCIDLVLAGDPVGGGADGGADAGSGGGTPAPAASSSDDGGCSVSHGGRNAGSAWLGLAGAVGLMALARRRSSRRAARAL